MPSSDPDLSGVNAEWAFTRYEMVQERLPQAVFPARSARAHDLGDISHRFDVFLLDAFGVLNVGNSAVPGAVERVRQLEAMGKDVLLFSNSSKHGLTQTLERINALGYSFSRVNAITSRWCMARAMRDLDQVRYWAAAATGRSNLDRLPAAPGLLEDDPGEYEKADGFLLISSHEWNGKRQDMLVRTLEKHPRPVLVANPDIAAPRENGFSLAIGYWAHDLADRIPALPLTFFGKPYDQIYAEALRRLEAQGRHVDRDRVLMVGDSLHTDILGGAAAGFKTALIMDHGMFRDLNIEDYICRSGIRPDFILDTV